MKRLITTIALLAVTLAAEAATPTATVTGNLVDITGTPNDARIRFIPKSTPLAIGNTTVVRMPTFVNTTNGSFSKSLVGGLYDTYIGNDQTAISILVPSRGTWTYNQCAILAVNAAMFAVNDPYLLQLDARSLTNVHAPVHIPPALGSNAIVLQEREVGPPVALAWVSGPSNLLYAAHAGDASALTNFPALVVASTNGKAANLNNYFGSPATNRTPYWAGVQGAYGDWNTHSLVDGDGKNILQIFNKPDPAGMIYYWGDQNVKAQSMRVAGASAGNPDPRITLPFVDSNDEEENTWSFHTNDLTYKFNGAVLGKLFQVNIDNGAQTFGEATRTNTLQGSNVVFVAGGVEAARFLTNQLFVLLSGLAISNTADGQVYTINGDTESALHLVNAGLKVDGNLSASKFFGDGGGITGKYLEKTTNNFQMDGTESVVGLNGNLSIKLPPASTAPVGKPYTVICLTAGTNSLRTIGGDTINGASSWTNIQQWKYTTFITTGTRWLVTGQN